MIQSNNRFFYRKTPDIQQLFLCPKNERPPWCLSEYQAKFCVDPVCLRADESHPNNLVYSSFGELKLPYNISLCPETLWAQRDYTPEDICAWLNEVCEDVKLEGGFFFFYWGEICVKTTLDGKYIQSILPYYNHMIRSSATMEAYYHQVHVDRGVFNGFSLGQARL